MIKPNKQKSIGIVEVRSFRCSPTKHIDLLPQDQDFCFQLYSRLAERSQQAENQLEQILLQAANLPCLFSASMLNLIFGTHNERLMNQMVVSFAPVTWVCDNSCRRLLARHTIYLMIFWLAYSESFIRSRCMTVRHS